MRRWLRSRVAPTSSTPRNPRSGRSLPCRPALCSPSARRCRWRFPSAWRSAMRDRSELGQLVAAVAPLQRRQALYFKAALVSALAAGGGAGHRRGRPGAGGTAGSSRAHRGSICRRTGRCDRPARLGRCMCGVRGAGPAARHEPEEGRQPPRVRRCSWPHRTPPPRDAPGHLAGPGRWHDASTTWSCSARSVRTWLASEGRRAMDPEPGTLSGERVSRLRHAMDVVMTRAGPQASPA